MTRSVLIFALVATVACSNKDKDDDPTDDQVPTGSTDEPPVEEPELEVAGSLTYETLTASGRNDNGDDLTGNSCNLVIDYTGTEWTDGCNLCEYAFEIDAKVKTDNSASTCVPHPAYSFLDSDYTQLMGYWESYAGQNAAYGSAFFLGTYYYAPYPVYWTEWVSYTYQGNTYGRGTFSQNGDNFDWTVETTNYETNDIVLYDNCGVQVPEATNTSAVSGGTTDGAIDCAGLLEDHYTFSAVTGAAVSFSVDTRGATTAFDPWLYVTSDDECTKLFADDNFACTFAPTRYECPAATYTPTSSGTHTLVVGSYGSCTGDVAEYTVAADVGLTLASDDAFTYATFEVQDVAITGSGKITEK